MQATVLATMLLAAAFAHADDETDGTVKTKKVDTAHVQMEVAQAEMETARAQMEAAQAKMEAAQAEMMEAVRAQLDAARAPMEAARNELQAAAKRMAEASRQRLVSAQNRAFLGVLVGEQSTDGIVVAGVTPAGGAEAAGIESDDIIVAIDGESLTGHDKPLDILYHVLDDVPLGGEVKLTVSRGGHVETYDVGTTPRLVRIEDHWPEFLGAIGQAGSGHVSAGVAPAAPLGIPVRPLRDLLESLETTTQPRLVDIGEDLGDYFGVDSGVLVLNVPGKSELKPGDVVRRIDGADVASAAEARRLLAGMPGEDAEVEVRRKNRKVDVTMPRSSAMMSHNFLVDTQLHLVDIGEDLGDYFGVDSGVLVLNVPGKSELKPGDVVRRIDGADVASAAEAHRLLAGMSGEDAEVEVRRKNRKVDVTMPRSATMRLHKFQVNPKGKTAIIIEDPEVEVDIEVEKDDDE